MREYLATDPLVVVDADGHYLIDDRGRRLFDGTSALWCNLFGHRVPEIDAAVAEQLGRFAHTTLLGTTHPGVASWRGVSWRSRRAASITCSSPTTARPRSRRRSRSRFSTAC